jgi:hypothetical protein
VGDGELSFHAITLAVKSARKILVSTDGSGVVATTGCMVSRKGRAIARTGNSHNTLATWGSWSVEVEAHR